MSKVVRSPEALAAELRALNARVIPAIGLAVLREATTVLWLDVTRNSPVGSAPSLHRRGTSVHPGKYAASHRASIGAPQFIRLPDQPAYPRLGLGEISGLLPRVSLSEPVTIGNAATTDGARESYAAVLEGGRRMGPRGMLGSEQAPEGIYGPAVERLEAQAPRIIERAVDRALRGSGL